MPRSSKIKKRPKIRRIAKEFFGKSPLYYRIAQDAIDDALRNSDRGQLKDYEQLGRLRGFTECLRAPYEAYYLGYFDPDPDTWKAAFFVFWTRFKKGTDEEAISLWPMVWLSLPKLFRANLRDEKAEQRQYVRGIAEIKMAA